MKGFLSSLVHFDAIDADTLNRALVDWQHKMGPLHRPQFGHFGGAHGLFHEDKLVGVCATQQLIAEATCGLRREEAFELARVCAAGPDLCRVVVRLWRAFVFPACCDLPRGRRWAISYQDEVQHQGALYRLDGWVRIGRTRSGTDNRGREGVRRGRRKVVWAWCDDPMEMTIARHFEPSVMKVD